MKMPHRSARGTPAHSSRSDAAHDANASPTEAIPAVYMRLDLIPHLCSVPIIFP